MMAYILGQTLVDDRYLYPRHTKYVEGYIVFVFPSVRLSFRPCIRLVLTFYVKVFREVIFIHQEMALARGIRAPLGTCSSVRNVFVLPRTGRSKTMLLVFQQC